MFIARQFIEKHQKQCDFAPRANAEFHITRWDVQDVMHSGQIPSGNAKIRLKVWRCIPQSSHTLHALSRSTRDEHDENTTASLIRT